MNDAFIGSIDDAFDDGSASMAVVLAVADRRNVEPTALPPLYEWIDPGALDALFEPTRTRGTRRGRVTFEYDGLEIAVERADGISITIDGIPAVESFAALDANFRSNA